MSKAAPAKTSSSAPAVLAPDATTRKNVDLAVSAITKQFGEGSIMRLGDNNKMAVETVSTGSLAIDLTLGGKGLPRGRIIEITGRESILGAETPMKRSRYAILGDPYLKISRIHKLSSHSL